MCIEDDFEGFGPSLCEEQSVSEAGIESGMRVILRPGHAPLTNEVMLGLGPYFLEMCLSLLHNYNSNNIILLLQSSPLSSDCFEVFSSRWY